MKKYRKTYDLKENGRKYTISLSWKDDWQDVNVFFNRQYIGTIMDKTELEQGFEYSFDTGHLISIKLTSTKPYSDSLRVSINNVILKENWLSPTKRLPWIWGALIGFGGYSIGIGFSQVNTETFLSIILIVCGLPFFLLAYFVRQHSMMALVIALLLFILAVTISIVIDLRMSDGLSFEKYIWQIAILTSIFDGFRTLRTMKMDDKKFVADYVLPY